MIEDYAICCPGPSLEIYSPEDWPGRCVVVVNRAAAWMNAQGYRYQWFCAIDDHVYLRPGFADPKPTVGIIAPENMHKRIGERLPHIAALQHYDHHHAQKGPSRSFTCFSFTSALASVCAWGARNIDVFGCDWSGVEDWDETQGGPSWPVNRSESRWTNEAKTARGILRHYPGLGFRRHTYGQ